MDFRNTNRGIFGLNILSALIAALCGFGGWQIGMYTFLVTSVGGALFLWRQANELVRYREGFSAAKGSFALQGFGNVSLVLSFVISGAAAVGAGMSYGMDVISWIEHDRVQLMAAPILEALLTIAFTTGLSIDTRLGESDTRESGAYGYGGALGSAGIPDAVFEGLRSEISRIASESRAAADEVARLAPVARELRQHFVECATAVNGAADVIGAIRNLALEGD